MKKILKKFGGNLLYRFFLEKTVAFWTFTIDFESGNHIKMFEMFH